jgi:hypothetical protein
MDGRLWLTTIVPFAASLLSRSPRLPYRYRHWTSEELADIPQEILVESARIIELQLLIRQFLASRWVVIHFNDRDLVTSDAGYALYTTPDGHGSAYVFTIDTHTAVMVEPGVRGQTLYWLGDRWGAVMAHVDLDPSQAMDFNQTMGAFANRVVFGPTQEVVDEAAQYLGMAPPQMSAGTALFPVLDPATHIYDYFRVVCALSGDPIGAQERADALDWKRIAPSDAGAFVAVEVTCAERTFSGVLICDGWVVVDLTRGINLRAARIANNDPNASLPRRWDSCKTSNQERCHPGQDRITEACSTDGNAVTKILGRYRWSNGGVARHEWRSAERMT